jgi:hypothetical protein
MQEADFRCLRRAAGKVGDSDLLVSAEGGGLLVALSTYAELLTLAGNPVAMNEVVYIFGRSGTWGMLCTPGDFSVLGGVETFMNEYAFAREGRDSFRRNFLDWIRSPGWFVPTHITKKLLTIANWSERP